MSVMAVVNTGKQEDTASKWSKKILGSPQFQNMVQKRTAQEQTTGKTRLSLADVDERAKLVFGDDMLDSLSDMLEVCTADKVRMEALKGWIDWLDSKKREYVADEMAREVLNFYRAKLNMRFYTMKVNRFSSPGRVRLKRRPTRILNFDWAHRELMDIAIREAAKDGKRFSLNSDAERMQWEVVLRWFIFDDDSIWNVYKTSHIYGSTGRGKSMLCRCLSELGTRIINSGALPADENHFFEWNYADLRRLHTECKGEHRAEAKPSLLPMKKTFHGNWMLDELCNEPLEVGIYSDKYRFFETILTERVHGKTPKRALLLGNNNTAAVHDYYNEGRLGADGESRFSSRWRGCVGKDNVLVWVGEDRR